MDNGEQASKRDCAEHMTKELSLCWPENSWSCAIGNSYKDLAWETEYILEGNHERTAICDKMKYNQDCIPTEAGSECTGMTSLLMIHKNDS